MEVLQDEIIPRNSGASFIVYKGQRIRISTETSIDLVIFNFDNLYERFDQARTKVNQLKVYLSNGDVLYSRFNNIMMTIVEDTYKGRHDLQFGMCSRFAFNARWLRREDPQWKDWFKMWGVSRREDLPDHGCYENIMSGLQNYPILPMDIPSPFNLFTHMEIDTEGRLLDRRHRDRPEPGRPAHIDFRAEMNCLVGISACPESNNRGKPAQVQIFND